MTARLDTIQAAVLDAKMDIFDDELARRQQIADRYAVHLADFVETPDLAAGATSSWAQYTVKLPTGTDRDAVMAHLKDHGVPSAIYYPVPMHRQHPTSAFRSAGAACQ